MKRYALFPEPHVADPAWINQCVDISEKQAVGVPLKTVLDLVWDMQYGMGLEAGRNSESIRAQKYLTQELGWTDKQVRDFLFWSAKDATS